MTHASDQPHATPAAFWEDRYAGETKVWSGGVNTTTAAVAAVLTPGTAVDLGCGEGGDVVWLAEHGWDALGVDISTTAVERGQAEAAARGLSNAQFEAADLATWTPHKPFDLVTASFLQSPVELPRAAILKRASGVINPGGHLLIVTHAAMPPWASGLASHGGHGGHAAEFLTAAQELESLGLDATEWTPIIVEERGRVASHGGEPAELLDGVVLLRRR